MAESSGELKASHPQRPEPPGIKRDRKETEEHRQVDDENTDFDRLEAITERSQEQEAGECANNAYTSNDPLVTAPSPEGIS